MLVGEGIFCLGREFKKEFDFDSIDVSFEINVNAIHMIPTNG
jgi:hypothetical protein